MMTRDEYYGAPFVKPRLADAAGTEYYSYEEYVQLLQQPTAPTEKFPAMRIVRFEVDDWIKYAERDDFEQGCDPDSCTTFTGRDHWYAATIDALITQLRAFVPFTTDDVDAVSVNACEEPGRIDICGMEDSEGNEPTAANIANWKRGRLQLWYVTYTFQVEQVTREVVELPEWVKRRS